jgi:blocked-early-in-transport protein 1
MYHRQRAGGNSIPPTTIGVGGHEQLEEQNTAAEGELHDKVGLLKSLAIDIGDEVKLHNKLLNEADDTFDNVGGLLGNTIGKVRQLAKSGYRYYLLYLFLFCIFVFLVLWFYI